MAKIDEKLERFTSAILKDATKVGDSIKQEIDREYSRALSAAENEVLAEAFKYIKDEVSKIKTTEGKRLSKKLLDAKRILFLRRREIANDIFDELRKRISAFTETPEYEELLFGLSKKAAEMLGECPDAVLYLRHSDMRFADRIRPVFKPNEITVKEGSFTLGGIVVESKEKRVRIDETFDLSLEERYEHFTEMFGVSLAEL